MNRTLIKPPNKTQRTNLIMNALRGTPRELAKCEAAWITSAVGDGRLDSVQVGDEFVAATDGYRIHLLGTPPRSALRSADVTVYNYDGVLPDDSVPIREPHPQRAPIENLFTDGPELLGRLASVDRLRGVLKGVAGALAADFKQRRAQIKPTKNRYNGIKAAAVRRSAALKQQACELKEEIQRLEALPYVRLSWDDGGLTVEFPQLENAEPTFLEFEWRTQQPPIPLVLFMQTRYLAEALSIMPRGEQVSVGVTDSPSPTYWSCANVHAVVMPYRA